MISLDDLIAESFELEATAAQIQQGEQVGLSQESISTLLEQYDNWYAHSLSVLPDNVRERFTTEFEGKWHSPGIKKFLESPTEPSIIRPTPETSAIWSYWQYPYPTTFRSRIRTQRQILREVKARQTTQAARQHQVAETLQREVVEGFVFIAMPMAPDDPMLEDVHESIKQVAIDNHLKAERVDDPQSNERITDKILESLAKAEYVVADLSHGKPNVYFEAGYAQALGKIPIYVAQEGTKIEFDLKDYPILFYRNMRELRAKLDRRLKALETAKRESTGSK